MNGSISGGDLAAGAEDKMVGVLTGQIMQARRLRRRWPGVSARALPFCGSPGARRATPARASRSARLTRDGAAVP